MIMHADEARQSREAGEVQSSRAGRNLYRVAGPNGRDFVTRDQDGLIRLGGRASAVNQANMFQRDHACGNLDKVLRRRSGLGLRKSKGRGVDQHQTC